jgi:acyl-coenzyme A synthetase/AMP-(fatty) acid ligase
LRITIFGSEGLPVDLAVAWHKAAPNSIVENVYGPTELTVCCTAYRVDPATVAALADNGLVPIGEPLPGMRALVVDDHLRPVEPGEVGELLMTGPQVADGYWGDPGLTRQVFVTPPSETGTFYRTRDRVRSPLAGRPLTFLGRLDDQFKVNGIRVEPGEIEASLRRAAGCDAAVAVGWPEGASSVGGIVAFVEAQRVDEPAVVQQLRAELPRHMVPRRVIAVSPLPRTHRGKLDRRACLSLAKLRLGTGGSSGEAPSR